jgi:Cysteine sulfinate desulfinase/cysteine desulfurase and related enzymes
MPMKEISALAKKKGILVFSDATQAVGKIPVDVTKDGIDLMAFTATKCTDQKVLVHYMFAEKTQE